jgi:tetratricopeptide (TPR) repeat protein
MAQPDQAIYYGQLGSVYESEENWTDAFQYYDKAYGIDSSSSMYLASSGIALINMGQVDEGIRVLEQCVEIEPKNSSFQKALATAYLDSAYLGWTKVDGGQPVATDSNQVTLALSALKKALSLSFEDPEFTADLKKLEQDIDSMTRKIFVGNKGLPLLIGAFALLASFNGGGTIAIFYLLIVVLYVGGSFIPQYAINRQLISGNKFDEFGWISRYFFEDDIDYKNLFTEINFKNIFTVYKLCIGCSLILVAFPVFAIYNIYRYHSSQIHQWLTSPQNKD